MSKSGLSPDRAPTTETNYASHMQLGEPVSFIDVTHRNGGERSLVGSKTSSGRLTLVKGYVLATANCHIFLGRLGLVGLSPLATIKCL